jgi:hypothetical protein
MVSRLWSWFIFGAWKINLLVLDVFKRIFEKFYKFILCFYEVWSLNRAVDSVLVFFFNFIKSIGSLDCVVNSFLELGR